MAGLIIIIVLVLAIAGYILISYNELIKINNIVKEAFSTMDVYLKKRWDLIPNLVETVKGYAKHEKDTLENVVAKRTNNYENLSESEKIRANEELSNEIKQLMIIAESYPELKSNENFLKLSEELSKIEDEIANSRKYYNGAVRKLNNIVLMFPSNIIAKCFGFKELEYFEANLTEKNKVDVKFR